MSVTVGHMVFPMSQQVLSEAPVNHVAESESFVHCSRKSWNEFEVLRSTGGVYPSVIKVWVWLPDRIIFSC